MYANQDVTEGTLASTTLTITFEWKPKRIVLTNDSSLHSLSFKFNSIETYATLKPGETITIENISLRQLLLSSSSDIPYRVWAHG